MKIIYYLTLSVFLVFFVTFNSTLHADNHENLKHQLIVLTDPDCKNSKPIYLYTKGKSDAARIKITY